jgi:para-aminobenzoate synthetase component 1
MNSIAAKELMNRYGSEGTPFFFILDFDLKDPYIERLEDVPSDKIAFNILGYTNHACGAGKRENIELLKFPMSFELYERAFRKVRYEFYEGNTYLLNLTFPTRIECPLGLSDIYRISKAKYKLLVRDKFVVFSPEMFVRIEEGKIYSYPMKGTIDASVPEAEKRIMSDMKEAAEHATIVDLIRNDLSMVAKEVRVESYRYIETISAHDKTLLQVSSRIAGRLPADFNKHLGDILFRLLPAGSITGAPKEKTVEIIRAVENYDRGFYTGVCGYFDGSRLESGVMIRYIEKKEGILYYKSGGGITALSNADSEYKEMIDKIYVPVG